MFRQPPKSTRTDTLFPTRRSSDLRRFQRRRIGLSCEAGGSRQAREAEAMTTGFIDAMVAARRSGRRVSTPDAIPADRAAAFAAQLATLDALGLGIAGFKVGASGRTGERSEEHTSELQSLTRNSYADFCLK